MLNNDSFKVESFPDSITELSENFIVKYLTNFIKLKLYQQIKQGKQLLELIRKDPQSQQISYIIKQCSILLKSSIMQAKVCSMQFIKQLMQIPSNNISKLIEKYCLFTMIEVIKYRYQVKSILRGSTYFIKSISKKIQDQQFSMLVRLSSTYFRMVHQCLYIWGNIYYPQSYFYYAQKQLAETCTFPQFPTEFKFFIQQKIQKTVISKKSQNTEKIKSDYSFRQELSAKISHKSQRKLINKQEKNNKINKNVNDEMKISQRQIQSDKYRPALQLHPMENQKKQIQVIKSKNKTKQQIKNFKDQKLIEPNEISTTLKTQKSIQNLRIKPQKIKSNKKISNSVVYLENSLDQIQDRTQEIQKKSIKLIQIIKQQNKLSSKQSKSPRQKAKQNLKVLVEQLKQQSQNTDNVKQLLDTERQHFYIQQQLSKQSKQLNQIKRQTDKINGLQSIKTDNILIRDQQKLQIQQKIKQMNNKQLGNKNMEELILKKQQYIKIENQSPMKKNINQKTQKTQKNQKNNIQKTNKKINKQINKKQTNQEKQENEKNYKKKNQSNKSQQTKQQQQQHQDLKKQIKYINKNIKDKKEQTKKVQLQKEKLKINNNYQKQNITQKNNKFEKINQKDIKDNQILIQQQSKQAQIEPQKQFNQQIDINQISEQIEKFDKIIKKNRKKKQKASLNTKIKQHRLTLSNNFNFNFFSSGVSSEIKQIKQHPFETINHRKMKFKKSKQIEINIQPSPQYISATIFTELNKFKNQFLQFQKQSIENTLNSTKNTLNLQKNTIFTQTMKLEEINKDKSFISQGKSQIIPSQRSRSKSSTKRFFKQKLENLYPPNTLLYELARKKSFAF